MRPFTRIATPFAVMLAFVALSAAAQRHETRAVSGFHAIALGAPIVVELVQGDTESLTLDGNDAQLADLETVVEDGKLRIRSKDHGWFGSANANMSQVIAHVTAKSIDGLATAGSGDIRTAALKTSSLKIAISGSGDVRIGTLAADKLEVSISGSGDVLVAGKADVVHTSIAGSGDMKAARLESRESSVSIAGSGDAMLWVHDEIHVSVVGSGDVRYYGDPSIVKVSSVGSGSAKRLGASPS